MSPRETAAGKCLEAVMASLIVITLIVIVVGGLLVAFLRMSFAIRKEDRAGSLRFDAPSPSARMARNFVGYARRS
jgi:Tfp pilus assembly protein PilX